MIPLTAGVKAYLIYFLFRRELKVVFVWIVWINQSFSMPSIAGSYFFLFEINSEDTGISKLKSQLFPSS